MLFRSEQAVLVFRFTNEDQSKAVLAEAGFTTIAENQLQEAVK